MGEKLLKEISQINGKVSDEYNLLILLQHTKENVSFYKMSIFVDLINVMFKIKRILFGEINFNFYITSILSFIKIHGELKKFV